MFLTRRFFILLALLAFWSAMGVVSPWAYQAAQVGLVVLAVLVLLDAVHVWRFTRVTAVRQCKDRFSNAMPNEVGIRVENASRHRVMLTVRDELPREFRYHRAVFPLRLKAGEGKTIRYELTPVQRGAYDFGHVLVYVRCALGLLERKLTLGAPLMVKVYPAFEHLERYELACATDHLLQTGNKRLRKPGNSTEFDQIKDYVAGDDYRRLNWKASARAGRWMVNVYREERSQPIWCLIDKGRSMHRTFADVSLLDYAINASLVLSYVALRRSDMPGLVTFGAGVEQAVPAANRPHQLQLLLETLYAQHAAYAETDFSALDVHIEHHLHRRSLLVLFTDFTTLHALKRQLPSLKRLARQHALLVVFFEDTEVQDYAQRRPETMTEMRMNVLASDFCLEKLQMAALLRQHGIYPLCTAPQKLTIDVVNRYQELKHRQVI